MENDLTVPSVSEDFQFPSEVEYLSDAVTGSVGVAEDLDTYSTTGSPFDNAFTTENLQDLELMDLIQMAVVYAFIIAAALSAVFIFVGGMSFILSGGNDEKIKQAVNTIRYAIIGLVITILSFTFVTIVGKMFGFNFLDYLSYGQIRNAINRVIPKSTTPVNTFDVQQ